MTQEKCVPDGPSVRSNRILNPSRHILSQVIYLSLSHRGMIGKRKLERKAGAE